MTVFAVAPMYALKAAARAALALDGKPLKKRPLRVTRASKNVAASKGRGGAPAGGFGGAGRVFASASAAAGERGGAATEAAVCGGGGGVTVPRPGAGGPTEGAERG